MKKIVETKTKINGKSEKFVCEILEISEKTALLKYVIDRETKVWELTLKPGDYTIAFYDAQRSYVLYRWFTQDGKFIADYFNVADSVVVNRHEIVWRDLDVDVLFLENGTHVLLDEEELPKNISVELENYIDNTVESIVKNYESIVGELEKIELFRPQKDTGKTEFTGQGQTFYGQD